MNAFTISLVLFFILFVMSFQTSAAFLGGGGMAGGWSALPVNDPVAVDIAKFALQNSFPTNFITLDWEIIQANQQVVAGMNYDLSVRIRNAEDGCGIYHFQVYDRFGARSVTLNEKLQNC